MTAASEQGVGFTPGPWMAQLHHEKREGGRFHVFVTAGGLVPIACVPTGVDGYGREEGRANAKAIATLPDMIASLTECHEIMHECTAVLSAEDCAKVAAVMATARAALAKAAS